MKQMVAGLFAGLVAAIAMLVGMSGAVAAGVAAPKPAASWIGPPMHIVIVKSSNPACGDSCPQWISAEGAIVPETRALLLKVLAQAGKRKLPIFIDSSGGNTETALEIGEIIRAHHLDIAVTRTDFDICGSATECTAPVRLGRPSPSIARCASACAYLIAGGVRRFIPFRARVGVHDAYLIRRATTDGHVGAIVRQPSSTDASTVRVALDREQEIFLRVRLTGYLSDMGVRKSLVDIALNTPFEQIDWLSSQQLTDTHLQTNAEGGETLIGEVVKPPPAPMPSATTTSMLSMGSMPPMTPPSYKLVPTVAVKGTPGLPVPALLSVQRTSTPPPPPIKVTTSKPWENPGKFESDALSKVLIAEIGQRDFWASLGFMHPANAPTVSWSAEIIVNGQIMPPQVVQLSLELGEGRWFYAVHQGRDPASFVLLHGEMALNDYCELAQSSQVRFRLTAPAAGGIGTREIMSEPKSLGLSITHWPECQKSATELSQTPTP